MHLRHVQRVKGRKEPVQIDDLASDIMYACTKKVSMFDLQKGTEKDRDDKCDEVVNRAL